jgi:hypothetical protein
MAASGGGGAESEKEAEEAAEQDHNVVEGGAGAAAETMLRLTIRPSVTVRHVDIHVFFHHNFRKQKRECCATHASACVIESR